MGKTKEYLVRVPEELWERFLICKQTEEKVAPPFSPVPPVNAVLVELIGEYVTRWESIAASPDAMYAGCVLRKRVRR